MSNYKPKAGDRVRVVLEGEVAQVYSDGDFGIELVENYRTDFPHEAVISVEKVEPPVVTFKPGDVVRSKGEGCLIALDAGGYTYLNASRFNKPGSRYMYGRGAALADEFTSERYELVTL